MRRSALSNLVSSLMLISIALASGVIVYSAFNGLAAASNPPSASLQVNEGQLVQGANEATLRVQLTNLGSQPITTLTIALSGVQSSTASFSATVTLISMSTGSQIYSGSFTVPSGSTSVFYSFSAALNPNQNVGLVVTFTPSAQGASLFIAGSTYNFLVSSQPYAQASVLLVAGAP
ncbi:MAG: hypothetical protein LYZ69_01385 [Nitrososphaerales archaeon]|nr:hypothetical protein [Nitrososphaerales archaeon]